MVYESAKNRVQFKKIYPFISIIVVIIFFELVTGRMFTNNNLKAILNSCFYIFVGAVGYVFLIAEGILDFSIGANMGVSCFIAAVGASINPVLAIPFAIVVGTVIGAINGLIHIKLKVDAFITTLAMQFVLVGLLAVLLDGGNLAAPLEMLKWNTMTLKISVLVAIIVMGFIFFNLTAYGKKSRAIGSCIEAARQSGVNIFTTKMLSFVVMGGIMGLLGFFSLIRTGTSSIQTGSDLLLKVLTAVLLGGIPITGGASTRYRGIVIGSLTMAFLDIGMTVMGINTYDKQLITGILFLIAVAASFDRKNMTVIK